MFYLGTHEPSWLSRVQVPLFISAHRLQDRSTLPKANTGWAIDSAGFMELFMYGRWWIEPGQYVDMLHRASGECGNLQWAATQDYMCEPVVLKRTGLTVREHQKLTVERYLDIVRLEPPCYILPVLQGWRRDEYLEHIDMYRAAGIDTVAYPLVGVGSICRRQATQQAADILHTLCDAGIKIHAFGLKTGGLELCWKYLASSDSMAWSTNARKQRRRVSPACTHVHCGNCLRYALWWRANYVMAMLHALQTGQTFTRPKFASREYIRAW